LGLIGSPPRTRIRAATSERDGGDGVQRPGGQAGAGVQSQAERVGVLLEASPKMVRADCSVVDPPNRLDPCA
jgi:hypothetical protein